MFTLSNSIIISCLFPFIIFGAIKSKIEDSKGLFYSSFTSNPLVPIIYGILALIPLYFLYQHNSLLMTILKFVGLYIVTLFFTSLVLRKTNVPNMSKYSIGFAIISVILLIIKLFT